MSAASAWAHLRSLVTRGRRRLGLGLRQLGGGLLGGQPLATALLVPEERRFLSAIEAEITAGRFVLPGVAELLSRRVTVAMSRRGSLPLRVRRHAEQLCLLVPRRHPRVVRMVALLARDPASLIRS